MKLGRTGVHSALVSRARSAAMCLSWKSLRPKPQHASFANSPIYVIPQVGQQYGHDQGGRDSSRKGGHYKNKKTGDHYRVPQDRHA